MNIDASATDGYLPERSKGDRVMFSRISSRARTMRLVAGSTDGYLLPEPSKGDEVVFGRILSRARTIRFFRFRHVGTPESNK